MLPNLNSHPSLHSHESDRPDAPIPEFAFDCDPGDESDSRTSAVEVHTRSGTRSNFRAAPLPSGF